MAALLELSDIQAAAERARDVVLPTPLIRSNTLTRICGREMWVKLENLQRAGSFKIRGAMNALSLLGPKERSKGVTAGSAGNHAQGVALAASTLGISSTVFMPITAPLPKVEATSRYGAEIQLVGANLGEAVDAAKAHASETGATFIHPYDDPTIVAGQGTMGLEIADQIPVNAHVVIPIGGGGLAAGTATALKALRPEMSITGVEAAATPTYSTSRSLGRPTDVEPGYTMADGIAVSRVSSFVFDHVETHIDHLVTVDDTQMAEALVLLLERSKLVVEASGAAALAAVRAGLIPDDPHPVLIVLSGGNVDLMLLNRLLRHGLEAAGRFGTFRVMVPDVPGQLARVADAVAAVGANVVSVDHLREGIGLPFAHTEIRFSVETRTRQQLQDIADALSDLHLEVRE
jgi:threonine dehydratase